MEWAKDSVFSKNSSINCRGKLINISSPLIMGILNTSPDSFYDGGKHNEIQKALSHVKTLLDEGADIIDIGGYSSRPGAKVISENEEKKRTLNLIESIHHQFPDAILSIDTYRSSVAAEAIERGAHIINDISGGNIDPEIYDVASEFDTPYILMHMQGTPQNMQENPNYTNVIEELCEFFFEKIGILKKKGIKDIIIDPGFGFGKSLKHNYEILKNLNQLKLLGQPILVGFSRKSMINKLLEIQPENALNGTSVLNTIALQKQVQILRVHDVREAKEAVKIVNYYQNH